MNEELRRFVKEALEQGIDRKSIQAALRQAGWPERQLQSALTAFAEVDFPVAVPRPRTYLQAREAFLYLVSFIALYVSSFSFGALLFGVIDYTFRDPLSWAGYYPSYNEAIATASVMVALPVYLLLMRWLTRAETADPERRQSVIRRWLTYLTLVVAAGIILGDLIALLANLLAGDPALTFLLKALVVLLITGAIFGYYLWQMRRAEADAATAAPVSGLALRVLTAGVLLVALAGVGYSLYLLGGPAQQRAYRLDEQRIDDLRNIYFNIDTYVEQNDELPESLEQLTGPRYTVRSIRDPETDTPYEYRALDGLAYELCAVFARESREIESSSRFFSETSWDHGPGRACFALRATTDPGR